MLFNPTHTSHFDRLADQLRSTPAPNGSLVSSLIAGACTRLPSLEKRGHANHLLTLIAANAWTDVGLAIIALELPGWKLRRLMYEDGEWICSLSQQPELPADLDDTADGHHESSSLAILTAFLEARRRTAAKPSLVAVPRVRATSGVAVCCDNFS